MGVRACDVLFLENQEQVDARSCSPDVGSNGNAVPYKRRSCSPLRESRRQKRECPASIFVGVLPFWYSDQLLYRFRVKGKVYGRYDDENKAALARDYAARRIALLSGTKVREVNSAQFFS